MHEPTLLRALRGRRSMLPWRRTKAAAACRTLIRAREAVIGIAPDPWEVRAPPRPHKPLTPTTELR